MIQNKVKFISLLILFTLFSLITNTQAAKRQLVPPHYDFSWVAGNWKYIFDPGNENTFPRIENSEIGDMKLNSNAPPSGQLTLKLKGNDLATGTFTVYETEDGKIEVNIFLYYRSMADFTLSEDRNKLLHEGGGYFLNTSR